jgi:hypothetical protein
MPGDLVFQPLRLIRSGQAWHLIIYVSDYWIARSSRAMTAVCEDWPRSSLKYSTIIHAVFEMASRRDAR